MGLVTSFIVHEGIAKKLIKCSYIPNKKAARQWKYLATFMYFPTNKRGILIKMGAIN